MSPRSTDRYTESLHRVALPTRLTGPTYVRTNGLTEMASHLPEIDSSSVTRARTYVEPVPRSAAHLQLMSKPRLMQIIQATEARAELNAKVADYWRSVVHELIDTRRHDYLPSPATVMVEARLILQELPVDPHAQEHRETLAAELNFGGRARRRAA
jgi:hypothetical protein